MLLLYLPSQGLMGFPTWPHDVFAGVLLFGLGFAMWGLRMMGAGDAKLMLPLGMHIGYVGLASFAAILTAFSILFFAAIQIAPRFKRETGLLGWLSKLKTEGRVPYAIPLCIASVPAMLMRVA